MESILDSIKDRIGIATDDNTFDTDVIDLINGAFADLNDIGVGPEEGFSIENKDKKWTDYIEDIRVLSSVKDFVYLTVKLVFDPPTQSALLTSMERRLSKLEWRLNVKCDTT